MATQTHYQIYLSVLAGFLLFLGVAGLLWSTLGSCGLNLLFGSAPRPLSPSLSSDPKDRLRLEIIVAAFNEEKVIRRTIESVLAAARVLRAVQGDAFDLQITVGLDHCTDGTRAIVEELALNSEFPVRGIENPGERGKWNMLLVLIGQAAADWVGLVDSGSIWNPELLVAAWASILNRSVLGVAPSYAPQKSGLMETANWRLERFLKQSENRVGGPVSVHGATVLYRRLNLLGALATLHGRAWLNDDVVVPLVWDFYVDLGGLSVWDVVLLPRMATALLLLAPVLALAAGPALRRDGALPRMLALAAIGALASALAQHKGWSYHIVPIEMLALALGLLLAARWLDGQGAMRTRRTAVRAAGALAGLFALYVVSNGEAPWKEIEYSSSDAAGLADLLGEEARGERVLVMSPGIWPIFPALNYADVQMTLREMNMWLLEGAYETCLANGHRYREAWEMGRPEFYMFRTVAEDFARAPPAAVVVDKQPGIPWCGEQFDFIAYFTRHPLFAEVWSHYRLAASWGRYQVFTRKD